MENTASLIMKKSLSMKYPYCMELHLEQSAII
jgi:hypothetical protein